MCPRKMEAEQNFGTPCTLADKERHCNPPHSVPAKKLVHPTSLLFLVEINNQN